MTYRVGITQRGGNVDGWVFDLPGCRAIGSSVDDVQTLLPAVIAVHVAWLSGHGETGLDPKAGFEVVEALEGGAELCFAADRTPLSDADLERAVRHLGYAQADLQALVAPLTDAVLDWRPPASAVKIDFYPDVRSIREMLGHVATGMSFQLRGLGDAVARVPGPAEATDLTGAHTSAVARLRALDSEERSGKQYHLEGQRGATDWTAAKSVRRLINHHRFHTREIEQRLCWLTLGVPEVLPVSRE